MSPRRQLPKARAGGKVREATADLQAKLKQLKFEVPSDGQEAITKKYETIQQEMMDRFASVIDE
ncbi:H(+)-transporting V1 sector ATPase subunit A [Metarhizium acridum]|nr:H(+)-transporting V1 sector ATPase subunit A [Metarhizium acridum]